MDITINNRKSASCDLVKFCYLSNKGSFIEVTNWTNGEGYDVTIEANDSKSISLTSGQLDAINYLVQTLSNDITSIEDNTKDG